MVLSLPLWMIPEVLLAHRLLEILAGFKHRDLGSRDVDRSTGLRIAAGTCLALRNGECSKAGEADFLSLLEIPVVVAI
jgi:hypothetical protein